MTRNSFFKFFACCVVLLCAYIIIHHAPVITEQTLCIIKPGKAFENREQIQSILEKNNFFIVDFLNLKLKKDIVEDLYVEHKGKSFYPQLVKVMTEGPSQVLLLQKENAVADLRNVMQQIRSKYMEDETRNAIHGSDSKESAQREISIFYKKDP